MRSPPLSSGPSRPPHLPQDRAELLYASPAGSGKRGKDHELKASAQNDVYWGKVVYVIFFDDRLLTTRDPMTGNPHGQLASAGATTSLAEPKPQGKPNVGPAIHGPAPGLCSVAPPGNEPGGLHVPLKLATCAGFPVYSTQLVFGGAARFSM